jgi:NarL family two-component system response regulator LiaR
MSGLIKVLVVDDHVIVRKGIRALLATEGDIKVVGEAKNGQEAIDETDRLKPDVILMDLVMPEMDGIEAIRTITGQQSGSRILVLTSFATDEKVFPAIKAGALGYLLKDSNPEELVQAIHQVYRGESSLHPTIARKLLQELSRPPQRPPTTEPLTEREMAVLRLIAHGLSNQEIADQLVISEATVRTHVSNILGKLHLASRTQAALYALREGLASLDEGEIG